MFIGAFLISLATKWGYQFPVKLLVIYALIGLIVGLLIRTYGFSRIVQRNVARIEAMDMKASIFAFQALSSYLLVVVMMSMGMYIRHSALLPMALKVPGYYSIGTALFTSSVGYYRVFFKSRHR